MAANSRAKMREDAIRIRRLNIMRSITFRSLCIYVKMNLDGDNDWDTKSNIFILYYAVCKEAHIDSNRFYQMFTRLAKHIACIHNGITYTDEMPYPWYTLQLNGAFWIGEQFTNLGCVV